MHVSKIMKCGLELLDTVGWNEGSRGSIERKVFSFSFLGCSVFWKSSRKFLERINKKFHFIINAKLYIMFRIISEGFILVEIIYTYNGPLHIEIRAHDIICLILIVQ